MKAFNISAYHALADGTTLEQNWGDRLNVPLFAYDDNEIWKYHSSVWIATPRLNSPTDGEVDADNSSIVTDDEYDANEQVLLRIHAINGAQQSQTKHCVAAYTFCPKVVKPF